MVYDIGKPLVVEEMFPLHCNLDELNTFIEGSRKIADGYIGFYWGQRLDLETQAKPDLATAITADWLKYFRTKTAEILAVRERDKQ